MHGKIIQISLFGSVSCCPASPCCRPFSLFPLNCLLPPPSTTNHLSSTIVLLFPRHPSSTTYVWSQSFVLHFWTKRWYESRRYPDNGYQTSHINLHSTFARLHLHHPRSTIEQSRLFKATSDFSCSSQSSLPLHQPPPPRHKNLG